jgi:hypothetical protein
MIADHDFRRPRPRALRLRGASSGDGARRRVAGSGLPSAAEWQEEAMRRLRVWGFASRPGIALLVLLLVALSTVAVATAADEEDEDGKNTSRQGSNWFSFGNWFAPDKKAAEHKTPAKADSSKSAKAGEKKAAKKDGLLESEPSPADLAASRRALEQAALLRRQDVCDRLTEIALETNNAELANLAERLKQRAWEVYTRRTANLPGVGEAASYDLDQMLSGKDPRGGKFVPEGRKAGDLLLAPGLEVQPFTGREE